MRNLSLALLALAACPALVGAADQQPINVNGQNILPWSNLSGSDQVGFHPYAGLGVGYDGNVFKVSEPEDVERDTYTTYLIGAAIGWAPTEIDTVSLKAEYKRDVYREYDDEAGIRGSDIRGAYEHEGLTYAGFTTGGWRRSDDQRFNSSARELRDLYDAEARADYRTLENRYSLGTTWNREYYLNEDDDKDQNAFSGYARWAYEFAENSELFVRAAGTRIVYRSNGLYSNSKGAYGVVGYKNMIGAITGISAEVGAEYRIYDETLGANPTADDRNTVSPKAKADATYEYEEASYAKLTGFWQLKDSDNSYAADYYGARLDVRQRLLKNAAALASYQISEWYDQAGSGTRERERRVYQYSQLGGEYIIREGLGVQVMGGYEFSTAVIDTDYGRWRATANVNLVL